MTTTADQVAQVEANTAAIQEAVRTVRELRIEGGRWFTTIQDAVSELAQIAISDADQETRVRLVTEFAAKFEERAARE